MEQPILINIYNNIYKFIEKNKLQPVDDERHTNTQFFNIINKDKYISINAISNKFNDEERNIIKSNIKSFSSYNNDDTITVQGIKDKFNIENKLEKVVFILLLHNESEYDNKTANFKELLNSIKYPNCNIITISKNSLSTHVNKQIVELSTDTKKIFSYTYDKFKFLVYNHSLCSPHYILSKEDEFNLLNNILMKKKINLPKIKISDPQIVWIGGEIGDVIKIERDSEITGKSIYYRVVIND